MFNFVKNIGQTELIIVVLILVLIFGANIAKRLGKSSGETIKEVKKIKKEFTKALDINDDNKPGKN